VFPPLPVLRARCHGDATTTNTALQPEGAGPTERFTVRTAVPFTDMTSPSTRQLAVVFKGSSIASLFTDVISYYQLPPVIDMCVCVYIYIYTYIHIYMCVYIHTCKYMCVYIHIYMCVYIHTHTHIYISVRVGCCQRINKKVEVTKTEQ